MNRILGTIAVGIVYLGLGSAGHAQDYMNAFGGYPTPYNAAAPMAPYGLTTGYGYSGGFTQGLYSPHNGYGPGYVPRSYSSYYGTPGSASTGYRWSNYGSPVYGYSTYTYSYPAYGYRRGIFGWRARGW